MFKPTQGWASGLCKNLQYEGAEGVFVIRAVNAPLEISKTGVLTLLLEFVGGKCSRALLAEGDQNGDYIIVFMKIFEGSLPAFAAFALGKIRLVKGSLSRLADYMPLALAIVEEARRVAGYK